MGNARFPLQNRWSGLYLCSKLAVWIYRKAESLFMFLIVISSRYRDENLLVISGIPLKRFQKRSLTFIRLQDVNWNAYGSTNDLLEMWTLKIELNLFLPPQLPEI